MEISLPGWDGEYIISKYDQPAKSWIFIAIHSTQTGSATGGTRMMNYESPGDALADCMRLARSMTLKFALADFSRGGGKAVIAVPRSITPAARKELLLRYGQLLATLKGGFYTGPDIGTSSTDMDIISETAGPYVFCKSPEMGGPGEPGFATAYGTFCAIKTTSTFLTNEASSLNNKSILVQGVGSVGRHLAKLLEQDGAKVYYTDTDPKAIEAMMTSGSMEFIQPGETYQVPCDIFSPCAVGGILNKNTIPLLQCKAIVGAANNQLAEEEDAEMLSDHHILYAPDFAVNIGGAIYMTGIQTLMWTEKKAIHEIEKVKDTLLRIYTYASAAGISTHQAALEMASNNLNRLAGVN